MVIWKYELNYGLQEVSVPIGAVVLSVGIQNSEIMTWVLVDETAKKESRRFFVTGTGHVWPPMKGLPIFVGTVFQGSYVWHVFEIK
jgi:hypothetical protein